MLRIDKNKVFWKKMEGQTVVVNTETGLSYSLDGSGEVLWNGLVAGRDLKHLAAVLVETYEIDEQTAMQDAEAFLSGLKKNGFIR